MAVISFGSLLDRLKLGLRNEVCPLCLAASVNRRSELVCPACEKQVLLRQPVPIMTLAAGPIYAACEFPHRIKQLIYGLKFEGKTRYGLTLSEILIHYWQQLPQSQEKSWIVVPIPPHVGAERHHHLPLIARPFASHFGYDFVEEGLIWKRTAQLQHTLLNKRKRRENVADAFAINPRLRNHLKPGARLLVFDDLLTTGSTLAEAISTVYRLGHEMQVNALSVSHVPLAVTRHRLNPYSH